MDRVRNAFVGCLVVMATALALTVAPVAGATTGQARAQIVVGPWQSITTPNLGSGSNYLDGDSCANASFCVAVGSIGWGGSSDSTPLIEQWNGSTWTIATIAVPQPLSGAALTSVSCPTPTFCAAVGEGHNGPSGSDTTFIAQWNGTFWFVAQSPNYGITGDNDLASVACANSLSCSAVGTNYGPSPDYVQTGMIENWNGNSWVLTAAPTPPGATSSELKGVACSAGSCTAVGDWDGGTLVDLWNGSVWIVVPSPNAAGWSNELDSVSCAGTYFCTAVGSSNGPNGTMPLVESWNGTAWSVIPVYNPNPYGGYLQAVDCLGPSFCVATGAYYVDSMQNNTQNLAFSFDGSNWSASPTANLPGTPSTTYGELRGLSCVTGWACLAVGEANPQHASPAGVIESTPLSPDGYRFVASDGGIFSYGAPFYGSMGGQPLNAPIVGMAATPDDAGYWLVASDGGIFAFGDARFFGSMGGQPLNKPIVDIASTSDGAGYYEVASDGGIFAFGDAVFYGSMGGQPLNKPIVGIGVTPDGHGYYEIASDGGIFAFGDAVFYGSEGGQPLNKPIVGIGVTPGGGYYEVASDGGIFAYGGAQFFGSEGGQPLNEPIVGIAPLSTGYYEVASDGGIFAFGSAPFFGSQGGKPLNAPIVGMTT